MCSQRDYDDACSQLEELTIQLDGLFVVATGASIEDESTIVDAWTWGQTNRPDLVARIESLEDVVREELID
jgi:hypothetical protein